MRFARGTSHLFVILTMIAFTFAVTSCDDIASESNLAADKLDEINTKASPHSQDNLSSKSRSNVNASYEFTAPVFGIDDTPDGGILVAETVFPGTEIPPDNTSISTVKLIRKQGDVREVVEIETVENSPINGIESVGRGSFFATGGGLDQAVGAKVFKVSEGGTRLVGDIEAFEKQYDPDAFEGPKWKAPACEENPSAGFTAGPQSNPYHLTRISGNEVLVADGAGNTLLWNKSNGDLDWVAIFTPPVNSGGASVNPDDWLVLFPLNNETNCYVQPVPTSVAIGPGGDIYVGELTGVTPANLQGNPSPGLSRIWKINAGARNITCPSTNCEVALDGLTSVIDIEFGPDGLLYVVEYDANDWFSATSLGNAAGGTIKACDVTTGNCSIVEDGLTLPGEITFDKWDNLLLLENNLGNPTVRMVN